MALYTYAEFPDGLRILHTNIMGDTAGQWKMYVHFEQFNDDGLKDARIELPSYTWEYNYGFNDEEIQRFDAIAHNASTFFFEYAQNGGIEQCLSSTV